GIRLLDSRTELWKREGPLRLRDKRRTHYEFEVTLQPLTHDPGRRTGRGDESRNQDVDVEYSAHALRASRLVLCIDGDPQGLLFAQVGRFPYPCEQVEAEVAAQGILDHFAVAPTCPGRLDPDRAQDSLVKRHRGACFRHNRIVASICDCVLSGQCPYACPAARGGRFGPMSACLARGRGRRGRLLRRLLPLMGTCPPAPGSSRWRAGSRSDADLLSLPAIVPVPGTCTRLEV